MKLGFFRGLVSNFGDELSPWLFSRLLPDFFNDDESTVFYGIGSIIGMNFHSDPNLIPKRIIVGSGFVPQYLKKPQIDEKWDIQFVRGPRTAMSLGLPVSTGVGDSAILIRSVLTNPERKNEVTSFMPHWQSVDSGYWEEACKRAGINFIDARRPVEEVLNEILRSRLVIAEAMHGAIVADALRVPWSPITPINAVHADKWLDWAEALDMNLKRYWMPPSSLLELRWVLRPENKGYIKEAQYGKIRMGVEDVMCSLAAKRLRQLANKSGYLSSDAAIERATLQMFEKVSTLRARYGSQLSGASL